MISTPVFNPFALMVDPVSVLRAVRSSAGLGGLNTRVFRPLERGGRPSAEDEDMAAYDAEVDSLEVDSLETGSLEVDASEVDDRMDPDLNTMI